MTSTITTGQPVVATSSVTATVTSTSTVIQTFAKRDLELVRREAVPEPTPPAHLPHGRVAAILRRQEVCNDTSIISAISSACSCLFITPATTTTTTTAYTVRPERDFGTISRMC